MKKIFFATAIVIAMLASLTGCSKENASDPKVAKLETVLNIEKISTDVLDYFDLTYNYVDYNGASASKTITGAGKITFSIDNPAIGEEDSCPFTVELVCTPKEKAEKTGKYDATFHYTLEVNGYYSNGKIIEDSGHIILSNTDGEIDGLAAFQQRAKKDFPFAKSTYKSFFCKTTSGVWHIGTNKQ